MYMYVCTAVGLEAKLNRHLGEIVVYVYVYICTI